MRKLWYCMFYGLCSFTIVFSLYWIAVTQELPRSVSPGNSSSEMPSILAQAPVSSVNEQHGYYLCDEGGRLAVYSCDANGQPEQCLELTDIYVNLLPESDALRLKHGYTVWNRRELEQLLEDLGG